MKLIANKTNDGRFKGNTAFYCWMLHITNGITKADREARKSDDLLKRDFQSTKPLTKCVTDMTEIKASNEKLYVSAIFDCFDSSVIGLAMDTNQKASFCVQTLANAFKAYPSLRDANARCESMWGRMKSELIYDRYHTEKKTTEELKALIWRCFMSYWNNRRICSANGGLPPMVKRQHYHDSLKKTA